MDKRCICWFRISNSCKTFCIFAYGFETTDLHNLLNFEYSLLDDQGNLIEFQKNEDKIPALKFTIQVVN